MEESAKRAKKKSVPIRFQGGTYLGRFYVLYRQHAWGCSRRSRLFCRSSWRTPSQYSWRTLASARKIPFRQPPLRAKNSKRRNLSARPRKTGPEFPKVRSTVYDVQHVVCSRGLQRHDAVQPGHFPVPGVIARSNWSLIVAGIYQTRAIYLFTKRDIIAIDTTRPSKMTGRTHSAGSS